ncbi:MULTISPECIES: DNA translocase FtsK [unclassified Halomonas]|uniref:DNA translocase FtsK n=1 Tax=unclassified Halomonas TaxID=2609666 RepID=UPI0007D8F9FF|nr:MULTISPECIES: DNA translocase FtsK [unclassified Halomonas]MBT2788990.1 DNA translocase FtsK 4TM domain-containing protein [Halomonas sp. ISL-106]MBT2799081.1 DNA translocase FtsK 4TM domain-containing protein [Halomonas sp. ISL-104]OAL60280.1 cell division protein FtsK [Halomonas sp. ALS9]
MKVNKAVNKRTQRSARQTPSSASSARVNAAKDKARRFGLRLQGSVREGVVVILLALCVFLLLALFSYQPSDPGWSYQGPETDVRNWMGQVGAWLADVLYSLLGASALWWPGMFGFAAWWLIRSRQVRFELDPVAIAVHAGGLVLLIFGTTMLGALHFYHPESMLPYASGGILGEGLVGALRPLVGSGGVGLIAAALILSGFPLFSGMSWLQVADELGKRICRLGGWLSARRQARRMRAAQRAAAKATKPAPKPEVKPQVAPEVKPQVAPEVESQIAPPVKPETVPAEMKPAAEPVGKSSGGRERREPGFSIPLSSSTSESSETTDTSIPWEAAAFSSNKHVPAKAPAPTPSTSTAEPPVTAPETVRTVSPADKAVEATEREPLSAPRENAFVRPETLATAPQPVDEPKEADASFPLRATRQEEPSAPAASNFFVNDEAPADKERVQAAPVERRSEPSLNAEPPPRISEPEPSESVPEPEPEPARKPERVAEVVPEPVWDDEELDAEEIDSAPPTPAPAARQEPTFSPDESMPQADEGPALWTVEHLQSQRPAFETLDEPEGDVPSLQLLTPAEPYQPNYTDEQLADMAELLEVRLREYGVKAEVVDTWPGPVITRFEIKPAAGVKVSKISNLSKDLARSLMVKSVRVVEVIPGRPTVGIEIPNPNRAMIRLREVIDSDRYQQETSPLTMALGQDIGGSPVVANLGKMPHLLVAGTTGSGKSVGVNAMLISMLLKAKPSELKLIMVDPKMLELSVYDGIPHLLAPVVTDMKEAANSLRWCVAEMERRYKLMAAMGVRNIAGFNGRLDEAERAGAQVADPLWEPQPWEVHQPHPVLEKLPYIVVVIDEFADMFMIVGKKVEELIARLAQKARAAGIHLILATQRPSVDVVTGLIKANIPSRMAFQVSSRIDSRTILDQGGAESLLGHGDMLYLPAGSGPPNRIHGAFVDDDEVHRVVDDWKRRGAPEYIEEILSGGVSADALTGLEAEGSDGDDAEQDALYDEAVQFVTETRKASISAVQRRFKIGYNRAARLVEAMEGAGVVTSMGSNGAREVLAPPPVGH